MYELIGILVGLVLINSIVSLLMIDLLGLVLINSIVSLLMIDLLYRCYCLIKEGNHDFREVFER